MQEPSISVLGFVNFEIRPFACTTLTASSMSNCRAGIIEDDLRSLHIWLDHVRSLPFLSPLVLLGLSSHRGRVRVLALQSIGRAQSDNPLLVKGGAKSTMERAHLPPSVQAGPRRHRVETASPCPAGTPTGPRSGARFALASSRFGELRHLVTAVTGRGRVLCEVEVFPRDEGRPTRRKIEIAGLAIVAATALGMWSASAVAQSRVGKAEVIAASAPIAPHAIMVKLGRSLPSEYWSHPY